MNKLFSKSLFILTLLTAVCQLPAATVANSGFESYTLVSNAAQATKDHGFGSWQSGANRRVPGKWLLNLTSPGRVDHHRHFPSDSILVELKSELT